VDLKSVIKSVRVRASSYRRAMDLKTAIKAISPGVVQIRGTSDPMQIHPLGTGLLVNDHAFVVTAKHVIEGARKLRAHVPSLSVGVGLAHANTENMRANFTVVGFDLVAENERHDLALLRLRQNPFRGEVGTGIVIGDQAVQLPHGVVTLDSDRPHDGEMVASTGYPLTNAVLITSVGHVASAWASDIKEMPIPGVPGRTMPDVADAYVVDMEVNPGNSGGPVYAVESGPVIGVCVASQLAPVRFMDTGDPAAVDGRSLSYSSGLTIVVPARYVAEMLERHTQSSDSRNACRGGRNRLPGGTFKSCSVPAAIFEVTGSFGRPRSVRGVRSLPT
jgi:S1-C subfamily serine protease